MLHRPFATSASSTRFLLDNVPVTLAKLLEHNDFSPLEQAEIAALAPGQSIRIGGGAAPVFTLTRVGDQPDFREWSNALRFALAERLLKPLIDEPACPAPVVEVARKLIGKVRFTGYEAAIADERALGVGGEERAPAVRWVLVIVLLEQISVSWHEEEVEQYDVGESFDEVLHAIAGVNAGSLLKGGAK